MIEVDIAELREECIKSLYLCTDNISKYLDNEKVTEYANLKSYIEEYCLQEAEQDVANQALQEAKHNVDSSNSHTLEECFTYQLSNLARKHLNVNNHRYMIEFNKRVQKGQQLQKGKLDESDVAITESQVQHLDPITKKPFVEPVKNNICGHIYERNAILELINKRQRTKCPVAGCGNREPVLKQHLISDEELTFRMALTQHSTMIQERSIMDLDSSM